MIPQSNIKSAESSKKKKKNRACIFVHLFVISSFIFLVICFYCISQKYQLLKDYSIAKGEKHINFDALTNK